MMKPPQIRGLLLEEAVLHLLRSAGYDPIYGKGSDDTLEQDGDTLFVKGRGERHQIDAIADYRVQPPFSNSQRLLLEAKFYDTRQVGLAVIRNAVGVLNDVSQFFIAPRGHTARKLRYHYQYAVVSATKFTKPSQNYAYAHDVFLIPLGNSVYFRNLLSAIRQTAEELVSSPVNQDSNEYTGRLRQTIRKLLGDRPLEDRILIEDESTLRGFIRSCKQLGYGLMAVTASGFPLFFVPASGIRLSAIEDPVHVRIHRDDVGWSIANAQGQRLFSFDVPIELLDLYAGRGELYPDRALDMKQQELYELRAVIADGESLRVIRFLLDIPWLQAIRRRQ
jgi:hypothetical protein